MTIQIDSEYLEKLIQSNKYLESENRKLNDMYSLFEKDKQKMDSAVRSRSVELAQSWFKKVLATIEYTGSLSFSKNLPLDWHESNDFDLNYFISSENTTLHYEEEYKASGKSIAIQVCKKLNP